jgi:hypothetical protein
MLHAIASVPRMSRTGRAGYRLFRSQRQFSPAVPQSSVHLNFFLLAFPLKEDLRYDRIDPLGSFP